MPSKNSQKVYVAKSFYHLYNRGVERRKIFTDPQDYSVFLGYLKEYLTPKDEKILNERLSDRKIPWSEKDYILKILRLRNFYKEIDLLAYCLMPNHFHLLVRQNEFNTIDRFTNALLTRHAMYFNRKHKRVGHLYQDVYKAVLIESEEQLLHLSRYIHQNPLSLKDNPNEHQKLYTSLPEYLGKRKTDWIKTDFILSYFSQTRQRNSYPSFVAKPEDDSWILKDVTLEIPVF